MTDYAIHLKDLKGHLTMPISAMQSLEKATKDS